MPDWAAAKAAAIKQEEEAAEAAAEAAAIKAQRAEKKRVAAARSRRNRKLRGLNDSLRSAGWHQFARCSFLSFSLDPSLHGTGGPASSLHRVRGVR
jgi:hypothetical protein